LTGRFGVAVVEKLRISLAFMSAQSTDHHDDELGFLGGSDLASHLRPFRCRGAGRNR
jgi:hypothetical protein